MPSFVSYEVQTFLNGAWRIESIHDDREIAIFEAKRVLRRGRCLAVRVVEERNVPDKSEAVVKTIFRLSKVDEGHPVAPPPQAPTGSKPPAADRGMAGSEGEFETGPEWDREPVESVAGPAFMVLLLATILLAGIGAIVALRHFFGAP